MKQIFFTAIAAFAFMYSAKSMNKADTHYMPDGDSSYIYIYRGGQFSGALTNFTIYVDNEKLCKLSNNKYFKVPVKAGTHVVSAKQSGIAIMKKETEVEVDVVAGKSNYVSCNMKSSFTRVRLNMEEVLPKTGVRDISDMKVDNCQANVDAQ